MIITIARQCGSGGHEIGEKLAKSLGMELYDKKRFIEEAKERSVYEEHRNFFEETPVNSLIYGIAMESGGIPVANRSLRLVKDILAGKDAVVIGRCSNYIFREREEVTSIFVHGNETFRIRRLMEHHGLSEKKAREMMKQYDERRASFHKYCTGETWGMASQYQLCIDSSSMEIENSVELIKNYISKKQ